MTAAETAFVDKAEGEDNVNTDAKDKKAGDNGGAPTWEWPTDRQLSMYPCWVVRRVTEKTSAAEKLIVNMEWQDRKFTDVGVIAVTGDSLSETHEVTIPCLVNTARVVKHAELLVEIAEANKAKKKRELTWQGELKLQQQNEEKEQKKARIRALNANCANKPESTEI